MAAAGVESRHLLEAGLQSTDGAATSACSQTCCIIVAVACTTPLVIVLGLIFLYFGARNTFQLWALQRPGNIISRLLLPPIVMLESIGVGRQQDILALHKRWGKNFCASGQVWLGSFADVERALTSPQARTCNLGEHPLVERNLPDTKKSRNVFLLSLSDQGAGGSGDREAFRKCVEAIVFTPEVTRRCGDTVSKTLLEQLATDYDNMPHDLLGDFFTNPAAGLTGFLVKYLNYVLFEIDINDVASQEVLTQFLGETAPLTHYLEPFGRFTKYDGLIDKVASIYEASPVVSALRQDDPAFNNMTRRELAVLMAAVLRIAGVQGTRLLTAVVTGGISWPTYPGSTAGVKEAVGIWDRLDLDDDEEIRKYILECARLATPVTVSHRVATSEFSANISGSVRRFPKGTNIAVPLSLAMVDKDAWGPTAYDFNMNRSGLAEKFMGFNSVGGRHAGRECPGKELALCTITDIIRALGRRRRVGVAVGGAAV